MSIQWTDNSSTEKDITVPFDLPNLPDEYSNLIFQFGNMPIISEDMKDTSTVKAIVRTAVNAFPVVPIIEVEK